MKSTFFAGNRIFSICILIILMSFITSCTPGGNGPTPPPPAWETLINLPGYCSFSDFTPSGQSVLYAGSGVGSFNQYEFPTGANAQGVLSSLTSPASIQDYIGFAWSGSYLYFAMGSTVYKYNISGDSWTTPVTGLTYSHGSAETTADDSGYIYSTSGSNYLLKYNTADDSFTYYGTPGGLTHEEPRAAWDPSTSRVYLADYEHTPFYAFNPADNSFTALTAFPDSYGMSDAFCSDRHGHIYTANADSSSTATDVWVYTEATDSWSQFSPSLPFSHGDSAACSISDDGYLYFTNGSTNQFARIKIF
ncbi:MAG: hypothetical protein ABSD50_10590 [Smithella sp.]